MEIKYSAGGGGGCLNRSLGSQSEIGNGKIKQQKLCNPPFPEPVGHC